MIWIWSRLENSNKFGGFELCFDDDDDDDDLHSVWTLTVPMHLGLIHGPFVPQNLISAQQKPAPLPKFRIAPRRKISMSSGFKKGNQIYFPFLSKRSGKRIPSRFPNGADRHAPRH
jgi:hypothetical protein